MSPRQKKIAALGVAAFSLAVFVVLVPVRVIQSNRQGSAGMFLLRAMVLAVLQGGPADAAGIREGEEVTEINGVSMRESERLYAQARRLRSGDRVSFRLRKNARDRTVSLLLQQPFKSPMALLRLSVDAAVAGAFLATGLFVFLKKPDDKRALLFYLICLTTFPSSAFGVLPDWNRGLTSTFSAQTVASVAILLSIFACSFLCFLHFALIFPKDRPVVIRHPRLLAATYAVGLLVTFTLTGMALLWRFNLGGVGTAFLEFLFVSFWGVGCLFAACLALYRSYRESGLEEKRQLRWPLWGMIVALAAPFVLGLVAGVGLSKFARAGRTSFNLLSLFVGMDILSSLLYLLIPLSFAFAILKYRLMDIDLVIKKTIVYSALTGVILMLYLVLVGGVGGLLVKSTGIQNQAVTIAFTLAVAVLFVPARNRVQRFVDRRFFRRRYDYPQALKVVSHQVSMAADISPLLDSVAETLQQALQTRSVVIFAKDSRGQTFTAVAKVGIPDELLEKLRIDSRSVAVNPESFFEPAKLDLPEPFMRLLSQIHSALVVPVKAQGQWVAFFSLGSKLSDQDYDAEDLEFVSSAADQTAIGIENLRLRKEEQEYAQARDIQQALLPREIPRVEGCDICGIWEPARTVGGDYYDILKFDDRTVGMCIADVAGKGMPAALLMSNLQATVKAIASSSVPPKELCERINHIIGNNIASGKFITFFYGLVDVRNNRLLYANAGHNPPILLHANGSVSRLEKGGAVLSRLFRDSHYEQGEVRLTKGDRVILFTDGVTEARNVSEEEFGEERLIAVVSANADLKPAELQSRILEAVSEFAHGHLEDDVTLAVLGVDG